jgi:hypothetical protein
MAEPVRLLRRPGLESRPHLRLVWKMCLSSINLHLGTRGVAASLGLGKATRGGYSAKSVKCRRTPHEKKSKKSGSNAIVARNEVRNHS